MQRGIQPGSRHWDILELLARQGPSSAARLAREFGVAKTSMRQQVIRLVWEGWVDRTRRHGGPGRPVDVFSLSDQGRRLFARQSDEFTRSLLEELADSNGESMLRSLARGIGRRMTRKLRPRVGEGTSSERVDRLARLLNEGGAVTDVTFSDQGATLTIHTCPYHGMSRGRHVLCEMEREMVSQLVGAEAHLGRCMSDGHACCELEVAADPEEPTKNETGAHDKDELTRRGFVFNNPNATGGCGCGSSFSA